MDNEIEDSLIDKVEKKILDRTKILPDILPQTMQLGNYVFTEYQDSESLVRKPESVTQENIKSNKNEFLKIWTSSQVRRQLVSRLVETGCIS